MSDYIKFRLIDENNKIVGYEKWYSGALNKETGIWSANPQWLYSVDGKHWEPKKIPCRYKDRYTGFLDIEQKEIYENDIIKIGRNREGCVIFDKKHGAWDYYGAKGGALFLEIEKIKIVGNAWEDAEVLTGDNKYRR